LKRPNQTRYTALNLGTTATTGPNPNNPNKKPQMDGVWVHRGGVSGTGAEGCLTIDPTQWPNFISNFPKGTQGFVEVYR
jgi:hypothetical protein